MTHKPATKMKRATLSGSPMRACAVRRKVTLNTRLQIKRTKMIPLFARWSKMKKKWLRCVNLWEISRIMYEEEEGEGASKKWEQKYQTSKCLSLFAPSPSSSSSSSLFHLTSMKWAFKECFSHQPPDAGKNSRKKIAMLINQHLVFAKNSWNAAQKNQKQVRISSIWALDGLNSLGWDAFFSWF